MRTVIPLDHHLYLNIRHCDIDYMGTFALNNINSSIKIFTSNYLP